MKSQFAIRISVLILGILSFIVVFLILNPKILSEISGFVFLIWNILPVIIFFFTTVKVRSYYLLITPALLLFIYQTYSIIELFNSSNSTSGLIFLTLPVTSGIAMALGFLIGYILKEFLEKKSGSDPI